MKTVIEYIKEATSEIDSAFKRVIGNNENVKKNFIKLVINEFMGDNPWFKTKKELLDRWETVEDAIKDDELFVELESTTDNNDFNHKAFYNCIDLTHGNKRDSINELIYTILKNNLK